MSKTQILLLLIPLVLTTACSPRPSITEEYPEFWVFSPDEKVLYGEEFIGRKIEIFGYLVLRDNNAYGDLFVSKELSEMGYTSVVGGSISINASIIPADLRDECNGYVFITGVLSRETVFITPIPELVLETIDDGVGPCFVNVRRRE